MNTADHEPGRGAAVGAGDAVGVGWVELGVAVLGCGDRQRRCGPLQRAPLARRAGFTPSLANRIAQPTGTSYTDTGLRPARYYYKVTAEDAAGNVGPASNEASATVGDTIAPSAPGTLVGGRVGRQGDARPGGRRPTTSASSATTSTAARRAASRPSPANRIAQPTGTGYVDTTAPGTLLLQGHRRGRGRQHRPRLERGRRDRHAPTRPRRAPRAALDRTGDRRDRQPQPGPARPTTSASSATTSTAARSAGFTPSAGEPDRAADRHQLRRQRPRDRHLLLQGHRRGRRRQHQRRLQRGHRHRRRRDPAQQPRHPHRHRQRQHDQPRLGRRHRQRRRQPLQPPPRHHAAASRPATANRIAQPTGLSYADTGLAPGTYFYKLTAEDAAGNIGPLSNTATATVADTTPPSTPTLTANGGAGQASLSWTTATDNVAVTRYNLHRSTTQRLHPQHRQPDRAAHRHQLHRHRPQRRHLLLQGHRRRRRRQPQHRLKPSHQPPSPHPPSPASSPPTASTPAPAPPSPTNPAPATTAPSANATWAGADRRQIRQRPHLQRHQRHRHHPRHRSRSTSPPA